MRKGVCVLKESLPATTLPCLQGFLEISPERKHGSPKVNQVSKVCGKEAKPFTKADRGRENGGSHGGVGHGLGVVGASCRE